MKTEKKQVVVVFSGGQDSTTCLGLAKAIFGADEIIAVSFSYGQKHSIELDVAKDLAIKFGVEHVIVDVPALREMKSSALVNGGDTTQAHEYLTGLPASFVPARNALFLTVAFGIAMERGAKYIYTGVCETDYSGYPDCREVFIRQLNGALNVGYQQNIEIQTPLMHSTKAMTWALAKSLDILPLAIESHTCYNGVREITHAWGKGCGECPACELRAKGWDQFVSGEVSDVRSL